MKSLKQLLWFAFFFLIQAKEKNSLGNRRDKICTTFSLYCPVFPDSENHGILKAMPCGTHQVLLCSDRSIPWMTEEAANCQKALWDRRSADTHVSLCSTEDSLATPCPCQEEPGVGSHRSPRLCLSSSQNNFPLGDSASVGDKEASLDAWKKDTLTKMLNFGFSY